MVCNIRVSISINGQINKAMDLMKQGNWCKDGLDSKRVGCKLGLDDVLGISLLAIDDAVEQYHLNPLCLDLVLYQSRSPNLRVVQNCGLDNVVKKHHIGLNVLKMVLERMSLQKGQGTISLVDSRLQSRSQTKQRARKLNTQVSVRCGDLNLQRWRRWQQDFLWRGKQGWLCLKAKHRCLW